MYDLPLPQKGFWQIIVLDLKNDPLWLDWVWPCYLCFSISHNLWLIDLLNYVFSRIWRDLHREIETELLRLGAGQKNFIALWGRGQNIFIFRGVGVCPITGGRVNFLGERFIPICILWKLVVKSLLKPIEYLE